MSRHVPNLPRLNTSRTKTEVDYATNGVGTAAATAEPVLTAEEVEGYADACDVGQLEACAAQRITDSQDSAAGPSPPDAAAGPASDSVRGTPYASPSGGNWTKFKSYSTFRVRFGNAGAVGTPWPCLEHVWCRPAPCLEAAEGLRTC
jgi:hypothetical protein